MKKIVAFLLSAVMVCSVGATPAMASSEGNEPDSVMVFQESVGQDEEWTNAAIAEGPEKENITECTTAASEAQMSEKQTVASEAQSEEALQESTPENATGAAESDSQAAEEPQESVPEDAFDASGQGPQPDEVPEDGVSDGTAGVTGYAVRLESGGSLSEEEESLSDEINESESEILFLDALDDMADSVEWIDCDLTVCYDDHFNLCEQSYTTSNGKTVTISDESDYQIYEIDEEKITSYQVSKGEIKNSDTALITPEKANSTDVIATGVGSATIYLLKADDIEKVETSQEKEEEITGYQIELTVEPATLTLMFLTGQSNMEGYYSSSNEYQRDASIACEEGTVYLTYAPTSVNNGKNITGITYSSSCNVSNASDFVAGSLQEGTNMKGKALAYPLNSLTASGGGKTGPDSGLAYEWNQLTGEKVWVVNTAWHGTSIENWVPGKTYYDRSKAVWDQVKKTYEAEIEAGHYTAGDTLVFWLQGEADYTMSAEDYISDFNTMYAGMQKDLSPTACGIILTRAASSSSTHATEGDLAMTGPRIAQYYLGSSDSPYTNVYVVSNVNEQWVSDSGVKSYFQGKYGSLLSYPIQSGSADVPTTVKEVHSNIHYSQIGHNENGITAAYGMFQALNGATATGVSWHDASGQKVSSMVTDWSKEGLTLVPEVEPVYAAKNVTYSWGSGISYNAATEAVIGKKAGKYKITASCDKNNPLEVTVVDKETGVCKYNGTWYYIIKGIIQRDYVGVADYKNENGWWYINKGVVDFTYTGFGKNKNGSWYVENGKVTLKKNDVIKDKTGAIGAKGTWYYVVGSQVQTSYTGVADYKNSNGWWYIKKGAVDFSYTGLAKNKNGWWYVKDGKVRFNYTGFAENKNGKWYCENSKVTFKKNDVIKDTTGAIGEKGTWYYVVGSKVQTSYTGVANYKNKNGWWYIKNGKVDFNAEGVYKNKNGWWYVKGGKVRFDYNGIAQNENGWWYIKNGKVDFSYTGKVKTTKATYTVTKGKVNR